MTNALPPPEILLEQGAVILLNKPGGLLTQGPPGIDSLELRVKSFLKVRDEKPGKVYLGVPHRLDRPVSGVMVVVKNVRAANRISKQIRERSVSKTYWTVVAGNVQADAGRWEDWMRKIPDQAKSEIVPELHETAKACGARLQSQAAIRDPKSIDDLAGNPVAYWSDSSNSTPSQLARLPDYRRCTLRIRH